MHLRALNVEIIDEATEAASPLCLPNESIETAVLALPSGDQVA